MIRPSSAAPGELEKRNPNLIKELKKNPQPLYGARWRWVGGQQGPPGETRASQLKCDFTKANGKTRLPVIYYGIPNVLPSVTIAAFMAAICVLIVCECMRIFYRK